ncbi:MAG: hypothetical protein QOF51_1546 [Chloroflexota bacterium]|nr:hypothetical protein [Chloroflexota bacterium]
MKILLADDDFDLAGVTADALVRRGHEVVVARDGAEALRTWEANQPDIILLDLRLPKIKGLEVLRAVRERSTTPVILLSGRTGEEPMLKGFAAGADDYIEKPFSMSVLTARIEAVNRRAKATRASEPPSHYPIGPLILDVETHEVRHPDGSTVRLTRTEFRILETLVRSAPRVVPSERLVDNGWKDGGGDVSLLKTHISHLRTKLGLGREVDADIMSITGVGYRLHIA